MQISNLQYVNIAGISAAFLNWGVFFLNEALMVKYFPVKNSLPSICCPSFEQT